METTGVLIDEKFLPAALDLISNAQHSIYISTFKAEITTKPRGRALTVFFETLFERSRSGLDVRVLINRVVPRGSIPFTNLFAVVELGKNKVKVRCLPSSRICHAKVIIADEKTAILGSHNLSVKSCHNNFEISIMHTDANFVKAVVEAYQQMWVTGVRC